MKRKKDFQVEGGQLAHHGIHEFAEQGREKPGRVRAALLRNLSPSRPVTTLTDRSVSLAGVVVGWGCFRASTVGLRAARFCV